MPKIIDMKTVMYAGFHLAGAALGSSGSLNLVVGTGAGAGVIIVGKAAYEARVGIAGKE